MRRIRQAGFSLLEVVIAVGVFALAVTAVLALLPMLTRQAAAAADTLAAQQFPDALRVELQRLARADFDALAAAIPVMTAPLENGLPFVATRDGARLHSSGHLPPPVDARIPDAEQYFAIEVWRFNQPPLAYDPGAAVLPLYVRVSGPCRIPGSTAPTALADRHQVTFTLALNR
ncbi:MAG: prepilin-type N-terminal cleavage/methylation domain-containing protein [Opitutae bacterium]|nr:prepilin-type N-terminal cleavage/methylation domain-containing protein [Opitutae bacterium]